MTGGFALLVMTAITSAATLFVGWLQLPAPRELLWPHESTDAALAVIFAYIFFLANKFRQLASRVDEASRATLVLADLLEVISHALANIQPVYAKVIESCSKLFASERVLIVSIGGDDQIHLEASYDHDPVILEKVRSIFPMTVAAALSGRRASKSC